MHGNNAKDSHQNIFPNTKACKSIPQKVSLIKGLWHNKKNVKLLFLILNNFGSLYFTVWLPLLAQKYCIVSHNNRKLQI